MTEKLPASASTSALPPPLETAEKRPSNIRALPPVWHPLLILLGAGLAGLFGRLFQQIHVPLPFCLMRKATGLPCPGCGSTRSLLAWTHLDPLSALRFNPLFFGLVIGVGLWFIIAVVDRVCGTHLLERLRVPLRKLANFRTLAILLALNWLYLCLTLPK